jgi:hypothetical protein
MKHSKKHPNIDELLNKLEAIELVTLTIPHQLSILRSGHDWNFFVIPITVLLLLAGAAIGLNFNKIMWGFVGGAFFALLVGYGYHLFDLQWQRAAKQKVIELIDDIEGNEGFLPWFRPILAKTTYRIMFYKLMRRQQIEIEEYVRALHRLREKNREELKTRLLKLYPPPEITHDENTQTS